MYDGKKELEWWKQGTMCDKVGGNDGSTLPPGLNEQSEVDMWIALMCRSIKLKFEKVSFKWRESTVPIGYSDLGCSSRAAYSDLNPNGTRSSCIT